MGQDDLENLLHLRELATTACHLVDAFAELWWVETSNEHHAEAVTCIAALENDGAELVACVARAPRGLEHGVRILEAVVPDLPADLLL